MVDRKKVAGGTTRARSSKPSQPTVTKTKPTTPAIAATTGSSGCQGTVDPSAAPPTPVEDTLHAYSRTSHPGVFLKFDRPTSNVVGQPVRGIDLDNEPEPEPPRANALAALLIVIAIIAAYQNWPPPNPSTFGLWGKVAGLVGGFYVFLIVFAWMGRRFPKLTIALVAFFHGLMGRH